MSKDNIYITKTFLPPFEEYISYLRKIWDLNQITNNGPLVKDLENNLQNYLGVKYVFFVSNGTLALQIAIKALNLSGEVITTPFSHTATTASIAWEGCQPVFVDIDPKTFCIAPDLIEEKVTEKTTAILPTHVYGIPCDVEKIAKVAQKHQLKIIYDAAHSFGVKYKGLSLVSYGDVSTISFHATKIFHTVEGGAIVTNNDEIAHRVRYMRYFGLKGSSDYWGIGINGNNSEFHAAMGLCILPKISEQIIIRKNICELYDHFLSSSAITYPQVPKHTQSNYSYYPILFKSEEVLLKVQNNLNVNCVYPRRYFYPNLNLLPYVNYSPTPIAQDIASRVLCLPLSPFLDEENVKAISEYILESI